MNRELRVAFSPRAQPVWFRVIKWALLLGALRRYGHTRAFWRWTLGLFGAGLTLHLFYRYKTNGWTQAWGGWNDPTFIRPSAG
jgi:hypothetical protein